MKDSIPLAHAELAEHDEGLHCLNVFLAYLLITIYWSNFDFLACPTHVLALFFLSHVIRK